jgi:hypothetical protein
VDIRTCASAIGLFSGLIFPLAVCAQQQDRCRDILRDGAFDVSDTSSDDNAAHALTNMYTAASDRSNSASSTTNQGGGVKIGSFGLDATNSGEYRNQSQLNESVSSFLKNNNNEARRLAVLAKKASTVIAQAWSDCMRAGGLRASMRWTFNPNAFYLAFVYESDDPVGHPFAFIDRLTPRGGITCDPALPAGGQRVTNSPVTFYCTRPSNTAGSVDFHSNVRPQDPTDSVFVFPATGQTPSGNDGPFGRQWIFKTKSSNSPAAATCLGTWSIGNGVFSCPYHCTHPGSNGQGPFGRPFDRSGQCHASVNSAGDEIHLDYDSPSDGQMAALKCNYDGSVRGSHMSGTVQCSLEAGPFPMSVEWSAEQQ